VHFNALPGQEFVCSEDVGARGVSAQGKYGGVLQKEKRVANELLFASFDDTPLNLERLDKRDATEMEEVNQHARS